MNQEKFEDAEGYNPNYMKDKISFRDIVLQHLRKISQFASVEFRGGYWEIKQTPISIGGAGATATSRIYVPDSREVYSNAVECFADMLAPYFDKEMKAAESKALGDLESAYQENTIAEENSRTFKDTDTRTNYRDTRVKINRTLFRALCSFLYRKKYLELGSIED